MNRLLIVLILIILQSLFTGELHAVEYFRKRKAKKMPGECYEGSFSNKKINELDRQYVIENEQENSEKKLVCPFKGLCKRANDKNPYKTPLTLYMHIVTIHVECPYGESFGYCRKWNDIKKKIIKNFENEFDISELRVPLQDHVRDCHQGRCCDGLCSYIQACNKCKNIVTLARTRFRDHSCVRQKKLIKKNEQPWLNYQELAVYEEVDQNDCGADGEAMATNGGDHLHKKDRASHIAQCSIAPIIYDEATADLGKFKRDFEVTNKEFFSVSCWLENCDNAPKKFESIKAWRARQHCGAMLTDQVKAMKHFQSVHNVCFECMKRKALFKDAQDLIKHESVLHQEEVSRKSKCVTYGNQAICLLCVARHCQYKSQEKLELHIQQKHKL